MFRPRFPEEGPSYGGPYQYGHGPRGQGYGPSFYGRSDASYGGFSRRPEYGYPSYYGQGSQGSQDCEPIYGFEDDGTTFVVVDEPIPHFFDWWNEATNFEEDRIRLMEVVNAYKFVLLLGDFCDEVYDLDVTDALYEAFEGAFDWEDRAEKFVDLISSGRFDYALRGRGGYQGRRRGSRSPSPRPFDRRGGDQERWRGSRPPSPNPFDRRRGPPPPSPPHHRDDRGHPRMMGRGEGRDFDDRGRGPLPGFEEARFRGRGQRGSGGFREW
jgi:hypothetical protein